LRLPYHWAGVEHNGTIFCCVHCAKKEDVKGFCDRD